MCCAPLPLSGPGQGGPHVVPLALPGPREAALAVALLPVLGPKRTASPTNLSPPLSLAPARLILHLLKIAGALEKRPALTLSSLFPTPIFTAVRTAGNTLKPVYLSLANPDPEAPKLGEGPKTMPNRASKQLGLKPLKKLALTSKRLLTKTTAAPLQNGRRPTYLMNPHALLRSQKTVPEQRLLNGADVPPSKHLFG